jgi:hypothetical protein
MRNGRFLLGILLGLLLFGLIAGIGWYAYNIGVAQGLVESGNLVPSTTEGGVVPPAPYVMPFGFHNAYAFHRPFGFGFGLLGCLVPILFLLLIFALFRLLFRPFWGGPWRRGGWDTADGEIPQGVREWHRRMHEQDNPPPPTPSQSGSS